MIKSSSCPFRGPNITGGSQLRITTALEDPRPLAFEGLGMYMQTHHIITNNKNKKVNVCVYL